VLNATTLQLRDVEGVNEITISMFKAIQATLRRVLRAPLEAPITIGSWQALVDYLGVDMRYERVETLRLLFLDRKNNLIRDETMHRGTVDHTPLYPREVAKRALELHASALIMAHNHPSGDPTPSHADIETTKQVQAALGTLGIVLHDHLILASRGISSLRTLGHITAAAR
jgi:DNA repair protein RadC